MTRRKCSNISITRSQTDEMGEMTMRIDQRRLREILINDDIGDKPVAIIGITGCMRTGKSFLMNFVLRYLRNKGWENRNWMGDEHTKADNLTGIEWKSGRERNTTGIRIFEEKFEVSFKDNKSMIVLIMDSQGLFDHETPPHMNKTILTLSTMLSSVQIFNVRGQINADDILYLKTCIDFAQEAAKRNHCRGYLQLQRLMFTIRDHPEEEDLGGFDYTLDNGQNILKSILESERGGAELRDIRQKIKKSFDNVDCFPLPDPGKKVKKAGFEGTNQELEEDFLNTVQVFVEEIAHPNKLIPKKSKSGKFLTARELVYAISNLDNLFAKKMFDTNRMLEANVKSYYAAIYNECLNGFATQLEQYLISVDFDKIRANDVAIDARKVALLRFKNEKSMGFENLREEYRINLEKSMTDKFENMMNARKAEQKLKKARVIKRTKSVAEIYRKKLEKAICTTEEMTSLDQLHEKILIWVKSSETGIDVDELERISLELLESKRSEYTKLIEESVRNKSIGRRKKLFRLIHVQLHENCQDMWKKNLKSYLPEAQLEKCRTKIEDDITDTFWQDTLTPVEYEYVHALYDMLDAEIARIRREEGWSAADRNVVINVAKPIPGDGRYEKALDEYTAEFSNTLRQKIKSFPKGSQEYVAEERKLTHDVERKYYEFCHEGFNISIDNLKKMLKSEFQRAKELNDNNWKLFKQDVAIAIEGIIAKREEDLLERIQDQYILRGGIDKCYEETIEEAKQNPPEMLGDLQAESERRYYENELEEKMKFSRAVMKRKNLERHLLNPIEEPQAPTTPMNVFKKLFKIFKTSNVARYQSGGESTRF